MGKISKTFALFLTLIIAMSCLTLLTVKPANAQTVPTPSVPEFTVNVRDSSYDVPPTTTTRTDLDGRLITSTSPGYHVSNGNIVLTIINQPFTPYYDNEGYPINLYYHIRIKGSESAEWATGGYMKANRTATDTVTLSYSGYYFFETNQGGYGILGYSNWRLHESLSFQVEAFIGHTKTTTLPSNPMFSYDIKDVEYIGNTSGWSNSQTIKIGEATNSNTPNPPASTTSTPTISPTPTVTPIAPNTNDNSTTLITLQLEVFVIIVAVVGLLTGALLALSFRRHRAKINSQSASP